MIFKQQKWDELWGIDLRSLALFRISLALMVIIDLMDRSRDLADHYTAQGVLPAASINDLWHFGSFSFHILSDQPSFQIFLFILAGLCALSLMLGFFTKLSTILSWLFLVSLQQRNLLILYGADDVLRLLLFWSLFLPLGARWSLDSYLSSANPWRAKRVVSIESFCLLSQVAIIYFFSYLAKSHTIWKNGEAVFYVLQIQHLTTPLGKGLSQFPQLLKMLTFFTLYLECFGPFLAFSPWKTNFWRSLVVILFFTFHLGLVLTMNLGNFPFVCLVAWTVFIPSLFWDKLIPQTAQSIESDIFPDKLLPQTNERNSFFWGLKKNALSAVALICLAYVVFWNIQTLEKKKPDSHLYLAVKKFGQALHLRQSWSMFAPYPMKRNDWYAVAATLANGSRIDLLKDGGKLDWAPPYHSSSYYKSKRWRCYLFHFWFKKNQKRLPDLGYFLCKKWNATHPPSEQVTQFDIYYLAQKVVKDYPPPPKIKNKIFSGDCLPHPS